MIETLKTRGAGWWRLVAVMANLNVPINRADLAKLTKKMRERTKSSPIYKIRGSATDFLKQADFPPVLTLAASSRFDLSY